ncbi:unnamed protein product [Caenorhabditis sp. 36 PRJEB53466]|nr:unnamed protein product [Caenorhabditis sp. 36 PRJEB53466]
MSRFYSARFYYVAVLFCPVLLSRNSVAVAGVFFIFLYLIIIESWYFGVCGNGIESMHICLWLIVLGIVMFMCALYLPFYRIGK